MKAVLALMTLMLLAACSNSTGTGSAGADARSVEDRSGAPSISAPRDLSRRATNPCATLLSDNAVLALGYEAPGESSVSLAGSPTCTWRVGEFERQVDASVVLRGDLFVQTYRSPGTPVFQPLEIAGLPAVDTKTTRDAPTCTTTVGVADRETLDITALAPIGGDGRPATDPCEEGHRVAEAIVSTLPPK